MSKSKREQKRTKFRKPERAPYGAQGQDWFCTSHQFPCTHWDVSKKSARQKGKKQIKKDIDEE